MVKISDERGVALIEVIVTLIIVAVVGTMVISYRGSTTRQTEKTLSWLSDEFELSQVMEQIVADYREELHNESLDLAAFVSSRDTVGEINTMYGADIDDVEVEATDFQADTPGDPSTDYSESGTDSAIQKMTLRKGDQVLITLFTE